TTVELEKAEMDKKVKVSHGRSSLVGEINDMANKELSERYGMELVDVRIKHINYVPAVIPKIFDRMRSERIRIANEGTGEDRI
ncbi:MAG: SPFH domain-containing protein, partial [Planctomycetota bacterium]